MKQQAHVKGNYALRSGGKKANENNVVKFNRIVSILRRARSTHALQTSSLPWGSSPPALALSACGAGGRPRPAAAAEGRVQVLQRDVLCDEPAVGVALLVDDEGLDAHPLGQQRLDGVVPHPAQPAPGQVEDEQRADQLRVGILDRLRRGCGTDGAEEAGLHVLARGAAQVEQPADLGEHACLARDCVGGQVQPLRLVQCVLEVVALADARPGEPVGVELGRPQHHEWPAARVGLAEVHGEDPPDLARRRPLAQRARAHELADLVEPVLGSPSKREARGGHRLGQVGLVREYEAQQPQPVVLLGAEERILDERRVQLRHRRRVRLEQLRHRLRGRGRAGRAGCAGRAAALARSALPQPVRRTQDRLPCLLRLPLDRLEQLARAPVPILARRRLGGGGRPCWRLFGEQELQRALSQ
eukprot:scaffold27027_cov72-Phaeocystis_antarctica.AAC.1